MLKIIQFQFQFQVLVVQEVAEALGRMGQKILVRAVVGPVVQAVLALLSLRSQPQRQPRSLAV